MKRSLVMLLTFIVGIFGSLNLYGQDDYDLRFQVVTNNGTIFRVTVQIYRVTTTWDELGSSNFRFYYNGNAMTSPTEAAEYEYDDGLSSPWYLDQTVTSGGSGASAWASVNIDLQVVDFGDPVPQSWTNVGDVQFSVSDPGGTSSLAWDLVNTAVYDDGQVHPDDLQDPRNTTGLDVPLPVQITDIAAMTSQEEGVVLTWYTESETNCAGFHICRGEEEDGEYTRVTTALIPGHGNTSSRHEYTYADRNVEDGVEYWYRIEEILMDGTSEFYGPISVVGVNPIPTEYALSQNYPNPFNPQTTLKYDLPEDAKVFIVVYNMLGQKVRLLVDKSQTAGYYRVTWDGVDDYGSMVSSGIYFVHLQTNSFSQVQKITLVR